MDYPNRYKRNMQALSAAEIELLHTKRVCVVGCGGLGGYVTELLARIGVLHITAVDDDVFDETNLNRQLFATEKVLGQPKVSVCRDRICEVNSSVTVTPVLSRFNEDNYHEILQGHDVIVDALDSIAARLLLAKCSAKLDIPLVHGSIGGWYGQVATIMPGDETLSTLYSNADGSGIDVLLGNLPFTAAAVASLECAEVIKLLTGKGEPLRDAFMRLDLLNNEYLIIEIK